jgi:hypothetical protein
MPSRWSGTTRAISARTPPTADELGTHASLLAKRACESTLHTVWPNEEKGGRTSVLSVRTSGDPYAASTRSTAAAASSGDPSAVQSASAAALSLRVIAAPMSRHVSSLGFLAAAAMASGTLIVDQAMSPGGDPRTWRPSASTQASAYSPPSRAASASKAAASSGPGGTSLIVGEAVAVLIVGEAVAVLIVGTGSDRGVETVGAWAAGVASRARWPV